MLYKWLPLVDEDRCTGCGLCVDACGPRSLEMINGIATLVLPDTCGSEEHCIAVCRDEAIRMAWVPFAGTASVGLWSDSTGPGETACAGQV
jgi:NAD-dependent dihydropyrimidine dehydrogenase PreA subunit